MIHKVTRSIDVQINPEELAQTFASYDNNEQALFFNSLYTIMSKWGIPYEFQLASVESSEVLNDGGREVMKNIANYGKHTGEDEINDYAVFYTDKDGNSIEFYNYYSIKECDVDELAIINKPENSFITDYRIEKY